MANQVLPPLLLLLLFIGVILMLVYQEYRKLAATQFISRDISSDLLSFLESSALFPAKTYEEDTVLEVVDHPGGDRYIPVPRELINHQFLLNPVRLAILKILDSYTTYESSLIREQLGITWGKYTSHLNNLEEKGYVSSSSQFIDEQSKKVVSITSFGLKEFSTLRTLLQSLVQS